MRLLYKLNIFATRLSQFKTEFRVITRLKLQNSLLYLKEKNNKKQTNNAFLVVQEISSEQDNFNLSRDKNEQKIIFSHNRFPVNKTISPYYPNQKPLFFRMSYISTEVTSIITKV